MNYKAIFTHSFRFTRLAKATGSTDTSREPPVNTLGRRDQPGDQAGVSRRKLKVFNGSSKVSSSSSELSKLPDLHL